MNFKIDSDLFDFLGIEVVSDNNEIKLLQKGLINKVIKASGLEYSNGRKTPATTSPLGTDGNGAKISESWNYSSLIGMLMYLASNSRPDIQFSVHQCARFTHSPKQSHANALKKIVKYLVSTKDKGLVFRRKDNMDIN